MIKIKHWTFMDQYITKYIYGKDETGAIKLLDLLMSKPKVMINSIELQEKHPPEVIHVDERIYIPDDFRNEYPSFCNDEGIAYLFYGAVRDVEFTIYINENTRNINFSSVDPEICFEELMV